MSEHDIVVNQLKIDWEAFDFLIKELEEDSNPAAPNRPGETQPGRETLRVHASFRNKSVPSIQQEFQMTIRAKEKLGPKRVAVLLTIVSMKGILVGIDLSLYLSMVFLIELARGMLRIPNVNKDSLKKAISLAEIVILASKNTEWFDLKDTREIPEEAKKWILQLPWIPSPRTLISWKQFYEPEKLLELRIVPLEQFLEHSDNTSPYSGYTKGYHESGKGYRRDGKVYGEGRTPYSPEIDEDRDAEPVDLKSPIDDDPTYQNLCSLISRTKQRRLYRKK